MNIYTKLPPDIKHGFFRYFIHPAAELVKFYHRPENVKHLMEDICNYFNTLKKLNKLPFSRDHSGKWGRATMLNSLWNEARENLGSYYKIWERMYRINNDTAAARWIRWRYAVNEHNFQINTLWALFTTKERNDYISRFKNSIYI